MTTDTKTNFKKSDFLNAIQLVEKLNHPVEEIHKIMLREYKNGTQIKLGSSYRPMVILERTKHLALSNPKSLQLHPLALPKLLELLEQRGQTK